MPKTLNEIFQANRNPDGSYDGAGVLADLSGLSRAEIEWTWMRSCQLVRDGVPQDKRKSILMAERELKPWETRQ